MGKLAWLRGEGGEEMGVMEGRGGNPPGATAEWNDHNAMTHGGSNDFCNMIVAARPNHN